jgi:Rne/Rng family ribonuclease
MPPFDRVILAGGPGERRLALLRGGEIVEFAIDRFAPAAGDILLGRALPRGGGLDAVFIDIGEAQPGFLRRPGAVQNGDRVIVQVINAARRDKGASLTAAPHLAGRLLVYGGRQKGLSLSKQLVPPADRARLQALLAPLLERGEAVVARAAAAAAADRALVEELTELRRRWQLVTDQAARASPPARLAAPGLLATLLEDATEPPQLIVDSPFLLPEARRLLAGARLQAGCWQDSGAADLLEGALARSVPLRGGGRLLIDETEALTVIDVDGGGLGAMDANQAALPEIARQVRLRGIGGQILIDVIDPGGKAAMATLVTRLRQQLANDPTPTAVIGATRLGLIEVTRDRRRPSLAELFLAQGEPERSTESLALDGLRATLAQAAARPFAPPVLRAAPAVIHFLQARPTLLAETAQQLGRPLQLRAEAGMQGTIVDEVPP